MDPSRPPVVAAAVGAQIAAGELSIIGAMLESNLVGGRQELRPGRKLVRGQSITDGCLSWEETLPVLADLAKSARTRRKIKRRRK
jgi:3-deoxy-7-phosphoheptulonate synthase